MASREHLRIAILNFLKTWEREGSGIARIEDVASAMEIPLDDARDQLEILDEQGMVKATWTLGGGGHLQLTPAGKLYLEEHEDVDPENAEVSAHAPISQPDPSEGYEWDAYIAHASEDKDDFVRPLAEALSGDFRICYDEFEFKVGDSLRRKIDEGLVSSRFGIVILSPSFFRKEWPQKELAGLTSRERDGSKVILPVWLDVGIDEVAGKSPMLADRVAAKSSDGLDAVVAELRKVLLEEQLEQPDTTQVAQHSRAGIAQRVAQTEIEISITSQATRPPDMTIQASVRHVYGPPVVPLAIEIWSALIEGQMRSSPTQAYLEPNSKLDIVVAISDRNGLPDVATEANSFGWPLEEAPADIWIVFRYRDLAGNYLQVARTFSITKPSNQNHFEVGRASSAMMRPSTAARS